MATEASVRFTTSMAQAALINEALENLAAVTKAQVVASGLTTHERSKLNVKLAKISSLRNALRDDS